MLQLSAFADEIAPELDEQIKHCRANGVTHIELRGVWRVNVLDLTADQRKEIRTRLADQGLAVGCIGSPIGKVRADEPFEPHFDRFKTAVELAQYFGAPFVRIFSYYPPADAVRAEWVPSARDEIVRRMQRKVEYLRGVDTVLVHENERDIYGERSEQCLELLRGVHSPKFRAAFDFANFVQAGEDPRDAWRVLKPYTAHFHVKDAVAEDGRVVPAGEGDGHIGSIVEDAYASGYRGFLSLEPHLAQAGRFSGFSGPDLFGAAVEALRKVARAYRIPLAS